MSRPMTQRPGFKFTILSATALGLALAGNASGQSNDPIDDILVCQQIANEAARLACFDAAASQLSSERENGLVAIYRQDVEAVERDSFGFDLPSMPRLSLSMFSRGNGNSPDPLDPSSTPERLAAAESGDPVPAPQSAPAPQPVSPQADAESEDEAPARGLFARLTGRGNERDETPVQSTDDRTPINGVEVVQRNDEGSVERVVMEIERIRPMGYERHRFYMSNGQVWDQSGAGRINYDDDGPNFAEIRRASLDSYLMQINGRGRAIRVHRER
jgi:hypothetical protein